ncbi:hypothetical protein VTK73DRAFT_2168 [Phialemonium thermophilum]|uniref:Uncharacterized protein n=1 Tax=Phialemonium thermophilum TaxID=223376 RepID=A0ABR3X5W8_9PEZI
MHHAGTKIFEVWVGCLASHSNASPGRSSWTAHRAPPTALLEADAEQNPLLYILPRSTTVRDKPLVRRCSGTSIRYTADMPEVGAEISVLAVVTGQWKLPKQ